MASNPWIDLCLERIKQIGGTPCPELNCENVFDPGTHHIRAYCWCEPPYENGCHPNRTPGCCKTAQAPVLVISRQCYCCCTGMDDALAIAYDATSYKPIAEYQVGDPVYVASDASLRTWRQQPVLFSAGTGDLGDGDTVVRVTYGSAERNDALVVHQAQPFLTQSGALKPAAALIPGHDALMSGQGVPYTVLALDLAVPTRGFHHIATSTTPAASVDGHLLLLQNVVCGDWALQVALTTGRLA